jgi:hypothetical protein
MVFLMLARACHQICVSNAPVQLLFSRCSFPVALFPLLFSSCSFPAALFRLQLVAIAAVRSRAPTDSLPALHAHTLCKKARVRAWLRVLPC